MFLDIILYIGYIMLFGTTFIALGFSAYNMFREGKKALVSLAGIVVILVMFIIAYSLSVGEEVRGVTSGEVLATAGESRFVEASLYCFYVVITVAVGTAVYSAISGALKK